MPFTNLKKEEKVRSLIYVTNHELSSDKIIEKKQWEMLDVLWKYYIKECDYSYIVRVFRTDKYNVVYTFDWPSQMTLTNLDMLLSEFAYRTEQYKKIYDALHEEYNKGRPSDAQTKLVYNFIEYFDAWWTYDVEEFIDMYHSKYWLDNFVRSKANYEPPCFIDKYYEKKAQET